MDRISHSTQRAVLRERQLGFGVEIIAADRRISPDDVRLIANGKYPKHPAIDDEVWTLPQTALREMKRAVRGDFGADTEAACRCVRHNWCDIVPEWRDFL